MRHACPHLHLARLCRQPVPMLCLDCDSRCEVGLQSSLRSSLKPVPLHWLCEFLPVTTSSQHNLSGQHLHPAHTIVPHLPMCGVPSLSCMTVTRRLTSFKTAHTLAFAADHGKLSW